MNFRLADLDAIPRHGWVTDPSPVEPLRDLAAELGLAWFGVKRDDHLTALGGGTKVRKLDGLVRASPWSEASTWASLGAIGSGHLVALGGAARALDRRLDAYTFWEPTSDGVLDNLAATACHAHTLSYAGSRWSAALRWPGLVVGGTHRGAAVVPPGGTAPPGVVGLVRAGLELAAQVAAGELPKPDRIALPIGTGGTAVGLALGLALGGLRPTIEGVAVVEPWFTSRTRVDRTARAVRAWLDARVALPPVDPAPLHLVRGYLGPAYGVPTDRSRAARLRAAAFGLAIEEVYGGKAFAAVLERAPAWRGERVLFWNSRRGELPAPDPRWRDRLPEALRRRLDGHEPGRRRVILAAGGAAAAVAIGVRLSGYTLEGWRGEVLARWEAEVVAAAAEALLPPGGPAPVEVARAVDRYLVGMAPAAIAEVHGLLALVEHGTGLGGSVRRFTSLSYADRLAFLDRLASLPAPAPDAVRGIRDLVLLGHYQDPLVGAALGHPGPMVRVDADQGRPSTSAPSPLRAPAGQLPRAARR